MGNSEGSSEVEYHNNTDYLKKRKISNKQSNPTPTRTRGKAKNKAKSKQKEGNNTRAKLNDIETKETIQRISKSRSQFFEKINKIDKPLTILIKKIYKAPK